MIAIAQSKMPTANLIEWDISNGLPNEILTKNYDSIISTYTLHHLADVDKITFIQSLLLYSPMAEKSSLAILLFKHVKILKFVEKKA